MYNRISLLVLLCTGILLTACFRQDTRTQLREYSSSSQVFELHTVEDLYSFLTYDERRYPLVSAHRGGPGIGFPENALETFERVAQTMPAIIECDVRLSKDSVLVLMHDETLDRTTNGHGRLRDFNYAELKQLRLKDTEGTLTEYTIPTLEEALHWGKGRVIFTLDVKPDVPYRLLVELIRHMEAEAFSIIITYSANQAVALHRTAPDLMVSASVRSPNDLTRLLSANIPDSRLVAFVGTRPPDSTLVKTLHDHGIKIILGTIGNLDRQASVRGHQLYADHIVNGADIVSTDRPFEAFKALDFYIRKHHITSPYIRW